MRTLKAPKSNLASPKSVSHPVVGRNSRGPRALATAIVWISAIYFLTPLLWLFFASTKTNQDLTTFGLWFGNSNQFVNNIRRTLTFNGGIYVRWLANSFGYAIAGAVGAAVLATLAGYGLAKYRFPGKRAVNTLVIAAIMVPSTALAIPTYLLFAKAGIVNTPLAVILPSLVSPFAVFLMREYSKAAVDQFLLEAARVDGAGEFRIFRQISLPLLAPGIATVLLFTFVAGFNNYFVPLIMLNNSDLLPVTVGLSRWYQLGGSNSAGSFPGYLPMVLAGSLMATVPLIISFLYLQRYWQPGLSSGAVKG
jgi:multiple sugar transport system permease protein